MEVKNYCCSMYHTSWLSWLTSGPKSNFICDNILTKAIYFVFLWLLRGEYYLANHLWASQSVCAKSTIHLCGIYLAWTFVCGHYWFWISEHFLRAKLKENCEIWGADNVQGKKSEHIFLANGAYCVYYPSNIFWSSWGLFKIGKYRSDILQL